MTHIVAADASPERLDLAVLRCPNPACGARFDEQPLRQDVVVEGYQDVIVDTCEHGINAGAHDWGITTVELEDGTQHPVAWRCGTCGDYLPEAQQVALDAMLGEERFAVRPVSPGPSACLMRYANRFELYIDGTLAEIGSDDNVHQPSEKYVVDVVLSAWALGAGLNEAQRTAFAAGLQELDFTTVIEEALAAIDSAERGILQDMVYTEAVLYRLMCRRQAQAWTGPEALRVLRELAEEIYAPREAA